MPRRQRFQIKPVKLPPMRECPLCGSGNIHRVSINKQWYGTTVRAVPVDECRNCGEKFYDPCAISLLNEATRKRRAG